MSVHIKTQQQKVGHYVICVANCVTSLLNATSKKYSLENIEFLGLFCHQSHLCILHFLTKYDTINMYNSIKLIGEVKYVLFLQ